MDFLFLHGFLSSPKSSKISDISDALEINNTFTVDNIVALDLYPTKKAFENIIFKDLIDKIDGVIDELNNPLVLGSSHGGLLGYWSAVLNNKVAGLVLMAPALYYHDILTKRENIEQWQEIGYIERKHPRFEGMSKLKYAYYQSLSEYKQPNKLIQIPTLVIHGEKDELVDVSYTKQFVHEQNTNLITAIYPRAGNHRLSNVRNKVVEEIVDWVQNTF